MKAITKRIIKESLSKYPPYKGKIIHGKIYTGKKIHSSSLFQAVMSIPVRGYWIFKVLASNEDLPETISVNFNKVERLKEVDPKDYPLWVGSKFSSQEFETLIKGLPQ
jgi:hypothetical protein